MNGASSAAYPSSAMPSSFPNSSGVGGDSLANAAAGTSTTNSSAAAARIGELAFNQMDKISTEFFSLTYGALVHEMLTEVMMLSSFSSSSSSASPITSSSGVMEEEAGDINVVTAEQVEQVNQQLLEAGRRIGTRLIEEYSAVTLHVHHLSTSAAGSGGKGSGRSTSTPSSASGAVSMPPFFSGRCRTFAQATESVALIGLRMFLGITATVTELHDYPDNFSLVLSSNPLTLFVELPEGPMRRHLCYSNIICGVLMGALALVGFQAEVRMVQEKLRGDPVDELVIRYTGKDRETFQTSAA